MLIVANVAGASVFALSQNVDDETENLANVVYETPDNADMVRDINAEPEYYKSTVIKYLLKKAASWLRSVSDDFLRYLANKVGVNGDDVVKYKYTAADKLDEISDSLDHVSYLTANLLYQQLQAAEIPDNAAWAIANVIIKLVF